MPIAINLNTVLLICIIVILLAMIYMHLYAKKKPTTYRHVETGSCSAATCGASDPVSDPDYNMREIAKQSILLEEHLVEKNKYCRDCQIKHFLHCIGLAEEAQMLAGNRIKDYPLLSDVADFYRKNMEDWLANSDTEGSLNMATVLREYRKQLIAIYYPKTT